MNNNQEPYSNNKPNAKEINAQVNETEAEHVNNQIKIVDEHTYGKRFLTLFLLLIAISIAVIAVAFVYRFTSPSNKPVENRTTTSPLVRLQEYVNKSTQTRRFKIKKDITFNKTQYQTMILILSPKINQNNIYMLLLANDTSVFSEVGTYNIVENNINLKSQDGKSTKQFIMDEKGLYSMEFTSMLQIADSEMKTYIDEQQKNALILNATPHGEQALYIENDKYTPYSFTENDEEITLGNKLHFIKDTDTLQYNQKKLTLLR